ncbi:TetR/AcrR family transcriptional regulator [Kitasatospora indigofera]|uniref:TetR/AcrR family transcriptional regulator n=1 Tax=Kitasatospora indigofera TaxID=67307 RepID=UPI0036B0ECEC
MTGRAALTPARVVATALLVVDGGGPAALTLTSVAGRAGVAVPSLYKHVPGGLPDLRALVRLQVRAELTAALWRSVRGLGGDDAVAALLGAYRAYALGHPHRYAVLTTDGEVSDRAAPAAAVAVGGPAEGPSDVFAAALAGYGLAGEELLHAARCLRAVAHGFASLETTGGFGPAVDAGATHARLTTLLSWGLRPSQAFLTGSRAWVAA